MATDIQYGTPVRIYRNIFVMKILLPSIIYFIADEKRARDTRYIATCISLNYLRLYHSEDAIVLYSRKVTVYNTHNFRLELHYFR